VSIESPSQELILLNLPVDAGQIDKELKELNGSLGTSPACDVIIDFSRVEIITSSSISNLLILRGLLYEHGHRLILCNVRIPTKCIFTVAGLGDVFEFSADRAEALAAIHTHD